ncbi:hypothetical protein D3C81_1738860 [compost metagenome]
MHRSAKATVTAFGSLSEPSASACACHSCSSLRACANQSFFVDSSPQMALFAENTSCACCQARFALARSCFALTIFPSSSMRASTKSETSRIFSNSSMLSDNRFEAALSNSGVTVGSLKAPMIRSTSSSLGISPLKALRTDGFWNKEMASATLALLTSKSAKR